MDELQIPEEGEPLLTFRVGVDFRVGARDAMEARALVERTLSAEDSDGTPFVSRTHRIIDDQSWGVSDWQQVPPRPSQAALVQEKYPGLVSDLAVIEGLGVLVNTPGALPEQTRERIREVLASLDCFVFAEDPGRSGGPRIFEGAASTAAGELAEGVYRAFDYDDREYALVVAPSELTPSGRVSAAIPKERNDARALDEISRLLEQHTRRQPLSELVRQVSRRMNTTRRAGFPSWIPLESEPERPPRPPARVPVGVIVWSDLDGVEPTVLADTSAARLARTIATTLHETLSDSDAYQPVTGQTGQAANPGEMAAVAVAFIDEHNIGEPVPVTVYPLAEELGERIQAGYPRAHWQHYVNDVYAFVFEYPNERRLAFWDEADFMGSIDGYTWVQEEFSPAENRWMTVAASSDMVSLGQLRRTVAEFNDTGEAAYRSPAETPDARVAARSLPARAGRPDAGDELVRRLSERAAALTDDERGLAAPARTSSRPGPGR